VLISSRIITLVVGFGLPIILTLLGYLPYMTGLISKVNPYLIYPSLIGTYSVRPLPFLLGNAPTIGQTLFILAILLLNVVFISIGYPTSSPKNTWFSSNWQEIMGYLTNRTGVLAFALAPLVIIFAGRNNILLHLTNWSHSTYMLLHRWIARMFALQVLLHSICELLLYKDMGEYETEEKELYWIWGAVATVSTCVMLVASHLYFRRLSYEFFLGLHIILAVFVLAGAWYHIELLFTRKWGYQLWLYATFSVWIFDRLARVLRIFKAGIRRGEAKEVTSNVVRVDVPGVRWGGPGMHAYAHFPALRIWTPWENHPFSVVPTSILDRKQAEVARSSSEAGNEGDIEKKATITDTMALSHVTTTAGITFFIKRGKGVTKFLNSNAGLLTLLDGPYVSAPSSAVLKCDRVLLIGGGIGITGLLSWIPCHVNTKLFWCLKQSDEGVVAEVAAALDSTEKEIKIGSRLHAETLLREEAQLGWNKIGVVVCGPGSLCDDVRAAVVRIGREGGADFELEVDAFSW
jgi:predicted ferric reductase